MTPPGIDLWVMRHLASVSTRSPVLNLIVDSGLATHIFGGIWHATALFVLWTEGLRRRQRRLHTGLSTILIASVLAGAFSLITGLLIAWTPPRNLPDLAPLYPDGLWANSNTSSFPSQSTAVYTAVAAGIHSLRPRLGTLLWVIVAVFVALPRLYVGGHFLTDVLGGLVVGLAAYMVAAYLVAPKLSSRLAPIIDGEGSSRHFIVAVVVFAWIFEIGTGFREAAWLATAVRLALLNKA